MTPLNAPTSATLSQVVWTLVIVLFAGGPQFAIAQSDLIKQLAHLDDQNLCHKVLEMVDAVPDEEQTSAITYYRFSTYLKLDQQDGLNKIANDVSNKKSKDFYDYLILGRWHQHRKEMRKAFENCSAAMELNADHTDVKLLDLRLMHNDVVITKDKLLAAEYVLRANHFLKDNPIIEREWIKNLSSSTLEQQVDLLKDFCERNPKDGIAHKYLGHAYVGLQDGENALPALDKAIELLPDQGNVFVVRANALTWLKRFDEALADHNKAIELEPTAISVHARGLFYLVTKEFDKAVEDFVQAMKLNPHSIHIRRSVIDQLIRFQQYGHAAQFLNEIMEFNEKRKGDIYFDLSRIYSILGEKDQALKSIDQAIELNSQDEYLAMICRVRRTILLAIFDEFDQSESELKTLAEKYPNSQEVAGAIEYVKKLQSQKNSSGDGSE